MFIYMIDTSVVYLPSMFDTPENFYFINTFIEDWSFKVWQFLFYNELYLSDESCVLVMLVKIQLRNNNINRMRTTFFIFKYLKPLKLRCAFAYAFAYTSTSACASDENTNIAIIGQHSIKRRFTIQEQRIFFSYLKLIKLPDSALKAQKKTIYNYKCSYRRFFICYRFYRWRRLFLRFYYKK